MSQAGTWISDISNRIQGTLNGISNNQFLDYAMMSGFGDIPIAAYGMTLIVLSTLAYATIADSKNLSDLSEATYNTVNALVPGITTSTKRNEKELIAKEEADYQKEIEKEEKEREKEEKERLEKEEKERLEKERLEKGEAEKNSPEKEKKQSDENDEEEEKEEKSMGGRKRRKSKRHVRFTIPRTRKIRKN